MAALGACGGSGGAGGSTAPVPSPTQPPVAIPVPPVITPALSLLAGNAGGRGNLDGKGDQARFWDPASVAVDSKGNVFVVDNFLNTIRKITPDGIVTTFAGQSGWSGNNDGLGADASFNFDKPSGIVVDKADNLYVADVGNNLIRKITPGGVVSTVAGHAGPGWSADGAGTKAILKFCFEEIGCVAPGMAFDSKGTLYFVEAGSGTIRTMSATGQVSTIASKTCTYPSSPDEQERCFDYRVTGLAIDSADTLYLSDQFKIRIMGPDGRMTLYAGARGDSGHVDGTGVAARFRMRSV
jgi:sugar lactone lactonase YvrE